MVWVWVWTWRRRCSGRWPTALGGWSSTSWSARRRPDAIRDLLAAGDAARAVLDPAGGLPAPRRPRGGRAGAHPREGRYSSTSWTPSPLRDHRRPLAAARATKGRTDEDLCHERAGRRPGQGAGLLHRHARLHEEDRRPAGRAPLADSGGARRSGRRASCCWSQTSTRLPSRSRRRWSPTASRGRRSRSTDASRVRAAARAGRRLHPAADATWGQWRPPSSTTPAATSSRSPS